MFCEKCGHELTDDSVFCENCGSPVEGSGISKEKGTKKWLIGGICGGVATVLVVIGVLFVTGVLGEDSSGIEPAISLNTVENTASPFPSSTNTPEPTNAPEEEDDDFDYSSDDFGSPPASITNEAIESVKASSSLRENGITHKAEYICDGSLKKAWVEGASGQGIGESVTFTVYRGHGFSGLKINAGYQKSKDLYYKNSRPKKITISFSDGTTLSYKLKDTWLSFFVKDKKMYFILLK